LRQQRAQQGDAQFARGDSLIALRVFIHDRVDPAHVGAARLAERDILAGDILQLDRHMLEHVAEPGALAFAQTPDEPARLPIGTSVLRERRQRLHQSIHEFAAQPAARPLLERLKIEQ
jgi:hypothetical protein